MPSWNHSGYLPRLVFECPLRFRPLPIVLSLEMPVRTVIPSIHSRFLPAALTAATDRQAQFAVHAAFQVKREDKPSLRAIHIYLTSSRSVRAMRPLSRAHMAGSVQIASSWPGSRCTFLPHCYRTPLNRRSVLLDSHFELIYML